MKSVNVSNYRSKFFSQLAGSFRLVEDAEGPTLTGYSFGPSTDFFSSSRST